MDDDEEEGIIWDSSQPSTSGDVHVREDDPLLVSIPSQKVEEFLCTSPSRVMPSITASDVARNISSQDCLFDDVQLNQYQNQLVLEDEEFFFDLPKDASATSVQLADALIDRLTADDQPNEDYNDLTELHRVSTCFSGDNSAMMSAECSGNFTNNEFNSPSTNETPIRYQAQTAGVYGLEISVEAAGKRKTSDYVYQSDEKALFAKPFVYIPFIVQFSKAPPAESILRIYACYSRGEHIAIPVRRCPHHLSADESAIREHFILSDNASAIYVNAADTNGRSYVCVPVSQSCEPLFVPLQFMCFSSCNGGINRRPLHICFTLESNGESIGHQEMFLKVCACPARDATLEGFQPPSKRRRTVVTKPVIEVVTKSHCVDLEKSTNFKEDDDTVYEIQVRGRHLYKLVCSIIASYELGKRYLREKAEENKLDTLKSPSTPLSHRTAIPTWLANLELSKYESLFSAKSLFVIDDLEGIINKKFLHSLGVSEEDACKMLNSYLSWFDVYNAQRQSSLSSHGSSIRVRHTRIRNPTVRYTP